MGLAGCGDLPQPFAGRPGANAMRLARPPPPRLMVPAPADALLASHDAVVWSRVTTDALVAEEIPAYAEPAHAGDWRLVLSASLQGEQVATHFSLRDSKNGVRGEVSGPVVPEATWAQGDPAMLQGVAAQAAPQILSLLRSADAQIKQSDPNSLYNRPARIFFAGVKGAPGDGNASLARGLRTKIPDTGDQLVNRVADADYTVRCQVKLTDEPANQQQIEIHWIVADDSGHEVGDVAQGKDVDRGSLNGYWGEIASVITDEAAGGVHEVITNASGRRAAASHAK